MRCKILFPSQVRKTQFKADPVHSHACGEGGGEEGLLVGKGTNDIWNVARPVTR